MIEKEKIEELKRSIDLVSLVESRGIPLKKNGKGYKGLCPFHEDQTPSLSVNPDTNLWQCFGCSKGGDAIRFIELIDNVAYNLLDRFLKKGIFRKKKGHQLMNFGELQLMARETIPGGLLPLKRFSFSIVSP